MKIRLYDRVRRIIDSARAGAARSVDTAHVVSNWLIGQEIVVEEQKGKKRAAYGSRILKRLSERLTIEYGGGYSVQNLQYFRKFFIGYHEFLGMKPIPHPLGVKLVGPENLGGPGS